MRTFFSGRPDFLTKFPGDYLSEKFTFPLVSNKPLKGEPSGLIFAYALNDSSELVLLKVILRRHMVDFCYFVFTFLSAGF